VSYLGWLAEDRPAQKALGFERMSRGWAHGTKEFKKMLVKEHKETTKFHKAIEADAAEMREMHWENVLQLCLRRLRIQESLATTTRKSAPWKVALATHLKATTTVTNPWLSRRLLMGDPDGVSRYCSQCRSGERSDAAQIMRNITDIRV
jgi:hypothetical protein